MARAAKAASRKKRKIASPAVSGTSVTNSAFYQGCVIHNEHSAQALIAVAKAAEENAKAIHVAAQALTRVSESVTVNGPALHIGANGEG